MCIQWSGDLTAKLNDTPGTLLEANRTAHRADRRSAPRRAHAHSSLPVTTSPGIDVLYYSAYNVAMLDYAEKQAIPHLDLGAAFQPESAFSWNACTEKAN